MPGRIAISYICVSVFIAVLFGLASIPYFNRDAGLILISAPWCLGALYARSMPLTPAWKSIGEYVLVTSPAVAFSVWIGRDELGLAASAALVVSITMVMWCVWKFYRAD
jgi:hypothetical protein